MSATEGSNQVSSQTLGGLVRITIAGTREFVEDRIASIMAGYPHEGYGTHFSPPKQQPDGDWTSHGSRYTSCD